MSVLPAAPFSVDVTTLAAAAEQNTGGALDLNITRRAGFTGEVNDALVLDVIATYKKQMAKAQAGLKAGTPAPFTSTDARAVLARADVDAVLIGTPDHWHAPVARAAMLAGKDVYVEKPVSHNVFEGRKIVEAARKYQKIVQTGTQSRSNPGLQEAIAWLQPPVRRIA